MAPARSICRVFLHSAAAVVSAWLLAGCGSSVSTSTSPSAISKCAVTFDAPAAALPAGGGTAQIAVKAERECPWTAEASDAWLSITAGRSGQGNGTVEVAAAPNGDPVVRTGGIMLNGSRAQITQAASECKYTLSAGSASFGAAGGSGAVDVRASSALCAWTAASNGDWISITSGASGKGSATVSFTVAPAAGPPRSGTLTIAGLPFEITQSEGCTFAIAPSTFAAGSAGASGAVAVTAPAGCPWTTSNSVSWITLAATSGTGSGAVGFTVAATTGPTRTGTLTIAGLPFTVTQSPGCSYDVSPLNHAVDPSGGARTVTVGAAAGCAWTASSSVPWITITAGTSGSGAGSVTFAVAPTTGPSRTGTLAVGGQTVTVVQSQGCTFAISPETQSMPAAGGDGRVTVTAGAGCAWTATSGAPWIAIVSGATGSGDGSVSFKVAATTGPARTGTLTIAGRTFTLNQGADCTIALSATSATQPAAGGSGEFDVRTAAGCGWTASSQTPWLTVTGGSSGDGNGTVRYSAAPNTGPQRTGTISAGGQLFTVQQTGGCTYAISPREQNVPSAGGPGSFDVATAGGCAWTATSSAPWISVTSGGSGNGPGAVQFTVAANTAGARSGTIGAGGQTFTVTQAAACSPAVAPEAITVPPSGGPQNVTVTAAAECPWTAVSNAAWIAVTAGASGSGSGAVQLDVQPNAGPARNGTATVAGRTVGITQESGCTFSIAPATQPAAAAGGTGSVAVTAGAGCGWTAVSNAPWITVTKGAGGSGAGSVEFSVDANATGAARTGTITIAGQTFTLEQAGS
ncbi:MAG TPA: BACON domain-containing carbohydrate-binding protein [Vicinamibacterales bacterium]|nr:BACON domain-containing carbohydrate-binding protein [Vicinamibacterales bacterium]